jgi:hypothetical protein
MPFNRANSFNLGVSHISSPFLLSIFSPLYQATRKRPNTHAVFLSSPPRGSAPEARGLARTRGQHAGPSDRGGSRAPGRATHRDGDLLQLLPQHRVPPWAGRPPPASPRRRRHSQGRSKIKTSVEEKTTHKSMQTKQAG